MATTCALPRGSRIVVTGANGYIASHIIDVLLGLGYIVRGTVREEKPWLDSFFEEKYGRGVYESMVVSMIDAENAFDDAFQDVDGVIHVATDVSFSTDPNAVIPFVKFATENILSTASKHKSVKRFVLTSSSSATIVPKPNVKGITIDENSWNDDAVAAAWDAQTPEKEKGFFVYAASKTEGERAAWKWVAENNPGFVFNAVLPNFACGTILVPEHQHGSTMGFVRKLLKGDTFAFSFPPEFYINVVDCARLHVISLLDTAVHDERVFAFAGDFNWADIVSILRKVQPNTPIPDSPKNEGRDYTIVARQDRARELLKTFFGQPEWVSLEKSITDGVSDLA